MKICEIVGRYGCRLWKVFCVGTCVAITSVSLALAAQPDDSGQKPGKNTKESGGKTEHHGTLTVVITMLDALNGKDMPPPGGTQVHLVGGEEPKPVDEKGRASFHNLPKSALRLRVMIPKLPTATCEIAASAVSEGDQIIAVQVDKSQEGKCTRLK